MSDIKLFRLTDGKADEMFGAASDLEKPLQTLIERNLEELLGVRFLKTEHSTGKVHGGRIDSLGLDENNSPVIIEYKRSAGENVINQGLFYLDWLMDHKADFEKLVRSEIDGSAADNVEWSAPRVICIAANFTRYDEHAVQQIGRNIELIRYRQFGSEFLLLELVNAPISKLTSTLKPTKVTAKTETAYGIAVLSNANQEVRDLFSSLEGFALSLGDDVQRKDLKLYTAFKRLRNFTTVEFYKDKLLLHVSLNPDDVDLVEGFTRDVRGIGHWGTGDVEVWVKNYIDLERAKPLIKQAFEGGAPRGRGEWSQHDILETIEEKQGHEASATAKRLIEWCNTNGSRVNWGKGSNDGSFCPVFDLGSGYPFIPFRVYTYGTVEILFNRMMVRENAPFDSSEKRIELLNKLNAIPGVSLPQDGIDRRPAIQLASLTDANALNMFLQVTEWAVSEVKSRMSRH